MKLLVQPEDGVAPVITAIARARVSIDIVIFRLDVKDVVRALSSAVTRGVTVRALVAHTNKGGEKGLRRLERELLDGGATVSRTAGDLVRYHGKMLIIDGRVLHLYGFNFTSLDITKSRSFGVVSTSRPLVQQARRLFEADSGRQPYSADHARLVVSPVNARARLAVFIRKARRQLLIYDVNVSDLRMVRLLEERQKKGVEVRIIGAVRGSATLAAEPFPGRRLHVRTIIRDGSQAFLGSQSLRTLELDRRREIGLFISERPIVKQMLAVFEQDWSQTASARAAAQIAEAHAAATAAAADAQAAAAEAQALAETADGKAAREALVAAATAAEQAKEAARDAEKAARDLPAAGEATDAAAVAQAAREAAKQAKAAVKEAASVP